jgi:L-gulonolactone oxidase
VTRIGLLRSDGYRELSPGDDLFAATIGGFGLTGVILWAEIQLQRIGSSDLDVEIIPYDSLEAFWQLAEASTASHEHTVAWIDFAARGRKLGRGIFTRANWRATGPLQPHSDAFRRSVPVEVPFCLLSGLSMRAFNALYYRVQKGKRGAQVQPYADFFHPLDAVADWNRLYGRGGFYQYQCVVPAGSMRDAIAALVGAIVQAGQGSALAVLKTCGAVPSPGLLSFPMEGVTLALEFPNRGAETLALMSRLDGSMRPRTGASRRRCGQQDTRRRPPSPASSIRDSHPTSGDALHDHGRPQRRPEAHRHSRRGVCDRRGSGAGVGAARPGPLCARWPSA